jgi:hypothetical protein
MFASHARNDRSITMVSQAKSIKKLKPGFLRICPKGRKGEGCVAVLGVADSKPSTHGEISREKLSSITVTKFQRG